MIDFFLITKKKENKVEKNRAFFHLFLDLVLRKLVKNA